MISEALKNQLGDWECLYPFFKSKEWVNIKEQLKSDFSNITPEISVWFRAFKECKYSEVKVVWLGLSPYYTTDSYTKKNTADGLAFSTDTKHSVPPSLFQIYKGMELDMWKGINLEMERCNNLDFLAKQGVLLLNSAFTTVYGTADRHLKIWKPFIQFVLKTLNDNKKGLIFCGFGKVANELLTVVSKNTHKVFERQHPAAASYSGSTWKHENLFSKVNQELINQEKTTIEWDKYLTTLEDAPF